MSTHKPSGGTHLWSAAKLMLLFLPCFAACAGSPAWADAKYSSDANGVIRHEAPPNSGPRYRLISEVPAGTQDTAPKNTSQPAPREQTTIYSFRDENGVVHFSRLPHLDTRYKLVDRIPATPTVEPSSAPKPVQSLALSQSSPAARSSQSEPIFQSSSTAPQIESLSKSPTNGGDVPADWSRYSFSTPTPATSENGALGQLVVWLLAGTLIAAIYAMFRSSKSVKQNGGSGLPPPEARPQSDERERSPEDPMSKPNWWDVLGVPKTAPVQDIRRAFREKISEYHPDKVASLGTEIRELAERKCKEINLAYADALRANGIEK